MRQPPNIQIIVRHRSTNIVRQIVNFHNQYPQLFENYFPKYRPKSHQVLAISYFFDFQKKSLQMDYNQPYYLFGNNRSRVLLFFRQFLSTFTRKPRNIFFQKIPSRIRRDFIPISAIFFPPFPIIIFFCDSVSV